LGKHSNVLFTANTNAKQRFKKTYLLKYSDYFTHQLIKNSTQKNNEVDVDYVLITSNVTIGLNKS